MKRTPVDVRLDAGFRKRMSGWAPSGNPLPRRKPTASVIRPELHLDIRLEGALIDARLLLPGAEETLAELDAVGIEGALRMTDKGNDDPRDPRTVGSVRTVPVAPTFRPVSSVPRWVARPIRATPSGAGCAFGAGPRKEGLRPLKLHCARHTWATFALEAGRSIHWVADMLGHADPAFTLRVYAHAMPAQEADLSFAEFGPGADGNVPGRPYAAPRSSGGPASPVQQGDVADESASDITDSADGG